MSLTTDFLNQTITCWRLGTRNDFGDVTFASPVQQLARWEDRSEKFLNPAGDEEIGRSVVFLTTDAAIGDYLFLGTSVVDDPTILLGAFSIKDFRKIPSLDVSEFERRAIL